LQLKDDKIHSWLHEVGGVSLPREPHSVRGGSSQLPFVRIQPKFKGFLCHIGVHSLIFALYIICAIQKKLLD